MSIRVRSYISSFVCLITLAGCMPPSSDAAKKQDDQNKVTPKVHTVEILQMRFVPSELVISTGDKVVFKNIDIVAHDITEAKERKFNSSILQPGQSWEFTTAATVDYYCSLHPVMKGRIVVE